MVARVGATQWTALADIPAFASSLPAPAAVRYAGFWIRLLAAVIDVLLLYALLAVAAVILALSIALAMGGPAAAAGLPMLQALPIVVLLCGSLFYFIYFPSGAWQATPGKRICGLHIIRTNGSRVTAALALGRWASFIVSAMPLLIGFLVIGWTSEKEGLHDMICGTRVVHGKV